LKISEFAAINNVTSKMLRHYDEIGLLKPSAIDGETGYRIYTPEQSKFLSWILILKNLDFSLSQIQQLLHISISSEDFIAELLQKRIEISLNMNDQFQKKIQIDKLIKILMKEGFHMQKQINLLDFDNNNVNELKKNMPNMEQFLENIDIINSLGYGTENVSILRLDISHFKQVNDDYGYEVGDRVILSFYNIIKAGIEELTNKAAIGRLGGDEFAVFAIANRDSINNISKNIISSVNSFDFNSLGCSKQMGCYIGVLISEHFSIKTIRKMLDDTIEILNKARQNGSNSIYIENFN
jgi:diguanylate cyclase (GGDEF)-like protein